MSFRNKIPLALILLCGFLSMLILPHRIVWAVEDTIIAIVNDDVVTFKDLQEYVDSQYSQLRLEGRSTDEINQLMDDLQQNGITQLIEDRLLISEANRKGVEVNTEAVDKRVSEIKGRYDSEQKFLDALLEDGNTVTDLRNKIMDQLKVKYIMEQEVKSKIFVNPQEVTDYFDTHYQDFKKPERIKLNSIFIAKAKDGKKAQTRINEALKLLQEGKDFADVVQQYSQSPAIGIVAKGEMLAQIEKVIFKLNPGEASEIIEVETGYYIFKLLEKIPPEMSSLEEVKDRIYGYLFQKKYREKFRTWMSKLKNDAYIEIK